MKIKKLNVLHVSNLNSFEPDRRPHSTCVDNLEIHGSFDMISQQLGREIDVSFHDVKDWLLTMTISSD